MVVACAHAVPTADATRRTLRIRLRHVQALVQIISCFHLLSSLCKPARTSGRKVRCLGAGPSLIQACRTVAAKAQALFFAGP